MAVRDIYRITDVISTNQIHFKPSQWGYTGYIWVALQINSMGQAQSVGIGDGSFSLRYAVTVVIFVAVAAAAASYPI